MVVHRTLDDRERRLRRIRDERGKARIEAMRRSQELRRRQGGARTDEEPAAGSRLQRDADVGVPVPVRDTVGNGLARNGRSENDADDDGSIQPCTHVCLPWAVR